MEICSNLFFCALSCVAMASGCSVPFFGGSSLFETPPSGTRGGLNFRMSLHKLHTLPYFID